MSSDFRPVPLYGFSVWKPEEMSVDYESAHQHPCSPLKLQVRLPWWKTVYVAYSFTGLCEWWSDSKYRNKIHPLLSQKGGGGRGWNMQHIPKMSLDFNILVFMVAGFNSLKVQAQVLRDRDISEPVLPTILKARKSTSKFSITPGSHTECGARHRVFIPGNSPWDKSCPFYK